ncbi:EAL domain-containing protein [Zoogloea sp. LCSB751]|uniref:EAL domain-containing protein n=1 Tax=Zoogloea sp. LCSB751 TaxID=1965277 RepID=UPI0009A501F3|nr:EAL domain-containing protein [Zoogloea sp. LCSB751]
MSGARFLSLRWRLLGPLLALWAMGMGLLVSVLYAGIVERFQTLVEQRAEAIVSAVYAAAETARDPADLRRFVSALGAARDVTRVVLVAGEPARVIAASDHGWHDLPLTALPDRALAASLGSVQASRHQERMLDSIHRSLDVLEPVLLVGVGTESGRLDDGVLFLRLDAGSLWQAAEETAIHLSIGLGAVLSVVAGLVYLLLSRYVLRPAEAIRDALGRRRESGSEDAEVRVPVARQDELGELAETLDETLATLRTRNSDIKRMTRLHHALSATNKAIVHAGDAEALLPQVCRIAVEFGELDLAWIGFPDSDGGILRAVAMHGRCEGVGAESCCLPVLRVPAEALIVNDPAAPGAAQVCSGCPGQGAGSFALFPIRGCGGPDGALVLRKAEQGFFDAQTVALLDEMSADIGFALRNYRRDEALRLAAKVFENNSEGIVIIDPERRVVMTNRAFTALTGVAEQDVRGRPLALFDPQVHPRGFASRVRAEALRDGLWQGEVWIRRASGESFPADMSISVVRAPDGPAFHYVGVFSDISQRKADEARIRFLANHDFLTGLPSRAALQATMDRAVEAATRNGRRVGLCFLDLDRFKNINDTLGHHVGDQLLVEVAERLRSVLRDGESVLRHGGDEFVVVVPEQGGPADLRASAERLLAALDEPFRLAGCEFSLSTSVGVAVYPDDGDDAEILLDRADMAMYKAKEEGRNGVQFFTESMATATSERLSLEHALRRALERGELALHYQPVVAADGRLIAAEALLRWTHPELGNVPPARFIPLAEESGLILPIGAWVLDTLCRQLAEWRAEGRRMVPVAANISPLQFRRADFVAIVAAALQRHGVPSGLLTLEVTESMVMADVEQAAHQLAELKALGLSIAIDDFGTGYSSLAYLRRFPLDKLKIDQSFVRAINAGPEDRAIVAAIVGLGHNLGLGLVAEGVESAAVADTLLDLGCDSLQGWHFGKAEPAARFAERLA